jgi:3'-phosphoadenosine 5'-phosphosulfate sulfotransferase (PAPS reductase)/FAD synthetase
MTESTHSIRNTKLLQMQALPLEQKIEATKRRIREWLERYPEASVSFSGGKDSTVLLHIARQVKKDIPVYFSNTGLEYPEIVEFVKSVGGVEIVRPKMSFLEVVSKYGYPVVSKRMAQYIGEVQRTKSPYLKALRLTGTRKDGTLSPMAKISNKWQFLTEAPFKISDQCCKHLKKNPLDSLGGYPIIGTMAQDSDQRLKMYFKHGCNAYDLARPRSTPLSFWKEEDIWEYLRRFNVPYSKIYDMGYTRTGCMFCMFGLHMEAKPTRFERMQTTHPQLYNYCMDGPLNLRYIIDYVYNEHEKRKELLK